MPETEQQFRAITPGEESGKRKKEPQAEKASVELSSEKIGKEPISETPDAVYYLGVRLPKAKDKSGEFVPQREKYQDYIDDKFSLKLQQKIATSFLQGDPILVEGGTSIGKTTTTRKMCAELGWEVHYCNLNGATDVEDLMGRYIPNPHRTRPEDPEYIFADGKVTSGLRQEKGKTKVIILDEFNSAASNILIRLHEVLDALERSENVVLSEDASETVATNREVTKIIALMNPPGKGYFAREPLDPAQLRRWVYQKEVTDLPSETFSYATDSLFNLAPETKELSKESFLVSPEQSITKEQLAEIPGIKEITDKYKEFHHAAKEMLKARKLAADQPQPFTYDDRVEPRRVRDFVLRFYNGDINETFQNALRYYYSNKIESETDRQKLEELINHVAYSAPVGSHRRGLDENKPGIDLEDKGNSLKLKAEKEIDDLLANPKIPDSIKGVLLPKETMLSPDILERIKEAKAIFGKDFIGPEEAKAVFGIEAGVVPAIPFSKQELERAKELGQILILRLPITMAQINETLKGKVKDGKKLLYAFDESTGKLKDDCWYKDEVFFNEEIPQAGWALVSKGVIPESISADGKDYWQQTKALAQYTNDTVFAGVPPKKYQEAIAEFNKYADRFKGKSDDDINSLLAGSDWAKYAEELCNLKINQLTRQSPVEVLYDLAAHFQTTDEKLLPNQYTWTKRRDSDGGLVDVGAFDAGGARVSGNGPGDRSGYLGVSFSRSL